MAYARCSNNSSFLKGDKRLTQQKCLKALAVAFSAIIWPLAIIFAFILVFTFLGNSWLGGINFSWQAMAPKFSRMNP